MNSISKRASLIILAVTAVVGSKVFFWSVNDPEGPNLLIVTVLAGMLYLLSWAVYSRSSAVNNGKKLLFAFLAQVIVVAGLCFFLS